MTRADMENIIFHHKNIYMYIYIYIYMYTYIHIYSRILINNLPH
jgi:hypothetical protein